MHENNKKYSRFAIDNWPSIKLLTRLYGLINASIFPAMVVVSIFIKSISHSIRFIANEIIIAVIWFTAKLDKNVSIDNIKTLNKKNPQ